MVCTQDGPYYGGWCVVHRVGCVIHRMDHVVVGVWYMRTDHMVVGVWYIGLAVWYTGWTMWSFSIFFLPAGFCQLCHSSRLPVISLSTTTTTTTTNTATGTTTTIQGTARR